MNSTLEHPPASGPTKAAEPKLVPEPPPSQPWYSPSSLWHRKSPIIAAFAVVAIVLHLVLRFGFQMDSNAWW